jgi:ketosteroid isomerase-like protein
MTTPALDVVRSFFDAPGARPDVLARDVEFLPLTGEPVIGPAAVGRALDDIAELFREYDVRLAQLIPVDDDRVIVSLERTGLSHHSDIPINDHFAQVYSVRSGRISRIESFRTFEDARDSLG